MVPAKIDVDEELNLETLNEENLGELYSAIAAINSFIPVGCFTVNPADGTLSYKHNYELPLEVGTNVLKSSVDLCMSTAVLTVHQFAYLLVEIDEGARTAQSAIDALLP